MEKKDIQKLALDNIDIPSLPPVAVMVLNLAEKETTSLDDLNDIISRDMSFSSRVLKIANSPFYGRHEVSDIPGAINMIGFDAMVSLVVGAASRDIYRRNNIFEARLWEHSLAVSLAATLVCERTGAAKIDDSLVAGLMHDTGKAVMNHNLEQYYAKVIEMAESTGFRYAEAETEIFGYNHTDAGGVVARAWNLPQSLQTVMEHHHSEPYPGGLSPQQAGLCDIVRVADSICLNHGFGIHKAVPLEKEAMQRIGLTDEMAEKIMEEMPEKFIQQRERFFD
ncbi:MAG: HDOD domain-containing protein [Dissulfurispiraceae bacterium]|jgi:putative nucleotidyltransferase with HDIG domain|nr:HDOD domain-containing protein [Dissulfurispiraceae bacterium]